MTTMTLETTASVRRLEELVARLLAALLGDGKEPDLDNAPNASLVRSVHQARRLRQSADLVGALSVLAEVDTTGTTDTQLRWLYAEWLDIARRRFAGVTGVALQLRRRQGGGAGSHRRRQRNAGSGGGPGDALAGGQASLAAQPAGTAAPA